MCFSLILIVLIAVLYLFSRCWQTSFEELTCHCGAAVIYPPVPCGTKPPACDNPCNRAQKCPHSATHLCHPDEPCPPCTMLVDKPCFGNHKVGNISCLFMWLKMLCIISRIKKYVIFNLFHFIRFYSPRSIYSGIHAVPDKFSIPNQMIFI